MRFFEEFPEAPLLETQAKANEKDIREILRSDFVANNFTFINPALATKASDQSLQEFSELFVALRGGGETQRSAYTVAYNALYFGASLSTLLTPDGYAPFEFQPEEDITADEVAEQAKAFFARSPTVQAIVEENAYNLDLSSRHADVAREMAGFCLVQAQLDINLEHLQRVNDFDWAKTVLAEASDEEIFRQITTGK